MVFYRYFQDISKVNVLKVLKKLILNITKALKLKTVKALKWFFEGILVAAAIALLFIHQYVFLDFFSEFSGINILSDQQPQSLFIHVET